MDKLFENYTDKNTRIVIPQSLFELSDRLSDEAKLLCKEIGDKVKKKKDYEMYDVVEALAGLSLINLKIGSELRVEPYQFSISTLSPYYDLVLSQYDNKNLKNNHFSITLLLEFEGINILFTSDIEKRTINRFYDNVILPNQIHYLKIPHHGSPKSEVLLDFMKHSQVDKFTISCSTVYNNSNLPDRQLIKKYKDKSDNTFCTSCKVKTGMDGEYGYGTLAARIDVINKTFSHKCFYDSIEL